MARKHVDPLKAKQKKQKILLAVLGVLFLGLVAFQGPKLMKQLHPSAAPTPHANPPGTFANTPGATGATPTLAAPSLSGAETPAATPDATGALASAQGPAVQDGQLASFSRFASKDPFAQQMKIKPTAPASGGGTASTGSGSSAGSSSSGSGSGSASAPTPGTAVISVNGKLYTVSTGGNFPEASTTDPSVTPLFHLISLTAHGAKISIVGGSYSNGAPAITLKENKAVTLMNTADGTRYTLVLKPAGTAVASSTPTPTTSTPTVTLPAP
jgi:hypothetical protein